MGRSVELLNAAADTMDDYSDPFHHTFLVEHDVTADECLSLSDHLAIGARIVAWAIEHPAQAAAALNAAKLSALVDVLERIG
jgi:hypothetical protein